MNQQWSQQVQTSTKQRRSSPSDRPCSFCSKLNEKNSVKTQRETKLSPASWLERKVASKLCGRGQICFVKGGRECKNLNFAISLLISCTSQCRVSLSLWSRGQRISLSRAQFTSSFSIYFFCVLVLLWRLIKWLATVPEHELRIMETDDTLCSTHMDERHRLHIRDRLLPPFTKHIWPRPHNFEATFRSNQLAPCNSREIVFSLSVSRLIFFVQFRTKRAGPVSWRRPPQFGGCLDLLWSLLVHG